MFGLDLQIPNGTTIFLCPWVSVIVLISNYGRNCKNLCDITLSSLCFLEHFFYSMRDMKHTETGKQGSRLQLNSKKSNKRA